MNSIFHYNSKPMQLLAKAADYLMLNFIYVLCCLPVFTIGAAQAGLFNAVRILTSEDNESSCYKAFFRGMRSGFGKITLLWCVTSVIAAAVGYSVIATYVFDSTGYRDSSFPLFLSVAGLAIVAVYQSMLTLFHSAFDCTAGQLVRNTFYVIMANLGRSILVGLLVWAPVILVIVDFGLILRGAFILVFVYYSVAFSFCVKLMRTPFQRLIDNMPKDSDPEPLPEDDPGESSEDGLS